MEVGRSGLRRLWRRGATCCVRVAMACVVGMVVGRLRASSQGIHGAWDGNGERKLPMADEEQARKQGGEKQPCHRW